MTYVSLWTIATVLIGGIATIGIYSFLVKENSFYRFFEHLYIGIAAGFLPILVVKDFMWPKILEPMLGLDIVQYPDGTFSKEYNAWFLVYLVPMVLGLLFYFVYSRRHGWLAKIAIGIFLGYQGGLAFQGFFAETIPQLSSSFKPLVVMEAGKIAYGQSISNTIFVFTLLAVMYYFFFSFRHKSAGARGVSASGRWLMMICFGAFFGSTVMARMALLVERLQFLIGDWWGAITHLVK